MQTSLRDSVLPPKELIPHLLTLQRLKTNGGEIAYIDNPTEEMQMVAVTQSAWSIKHIKNPSIAAMKAVIQISSQYIRFITNPPLEIQRLAVEKYRKPSNILQYIDNPADEIIEFCIRDNPKSIIFIKKPSVTHVNLALGLDPTIIYYVHFPIAERSS